MNLKFVSSSPRRSFWHLSILGSLALGCSFARTPFVLKELNSTNQPNAQTQHVPLTTRIARMTREQLADAYVKPEAVASWLSAIDHNPQPLLDLVVCLRDRQSAGDPAECYALFMKTTVPAARLVAGQISVVKSAWAIPPPPLDLDATPDQTSNGLAVLPGSSGNKSSDVSVISKPHVAMTRLADRKSEASQTELDVERLLGNIRTLAPTLLTLENVFGKSIESGVFLAGIKEGLAATRN